MEKKTIHIFWTGGMDSTLMMIKYSRIADVRVLPIYVSNANGRESECYELNTVGKIYEMLKTDKRTKAELLPIRIIADSEESIKFSPPPPPQFEYEYYHRKRLHETLVTIRKAQKKILDIQGDRVPGLWALNVIRIAEQYMPVMSYVKTEGVSAELGLNSDESIFKFPQLWSIRKEECGEITRYFLDEKNTDPDIYAVFKNVSFPLFGMNKVDVYNEYGKLGCEEIRGMLWHCYSPINGKPCGKCITCVPYIREGMYDMFDRAALLRYIKFCDRERDAINEQYLKKIEELRRKIKEQGKE